MTSTPRFAKTSEELPKDMVELGSIIAGFPDEFRGQLDPIFSRVVASTRRRRRTMVQEALSQLRLDMKYLVFDLEATRRERDALQGSDGPGENSGEFGDDNPTEF